MVHSMKISATLLASACLVLGAPMPSYGASATVSAVDNRFVPQELQIDPGDSVTWTNDGRSPHTVTSEDGAFDSGQMSTGGTFTKNFPKEGTFYYFCRLHGASGQVGMWGVVTVGDPSPPVDPGTDKRTKLVVPDDFPRIQGAVDAAESGTTILIKPGIYRESVSINTENLIIRGVDRFRTILHGGDQMENGIAVTGSTNVRIKDLTVRNFKGSGILFSDSEGYVVSRVDSIKNRIYGIRAVDSYDGVFKDSFAYGSGDSGFSVGSCLGCSALVDHVRSVKNYIGYSGSGATGVVILDSRFARNGVGMVSGTLQGDLGPDRGTVIVDNLIKQNNYTKIPAAGLSASVGIPFGTGIWLTGVLHNQIGKNLIEDNGRYGVLITQSIDGARAPMNNRVQHNSITGSGAFDLAIDGGGENNCFWGNSFRTSGPADVESVYPCSGRPFVNDFYEPVGSDVADAVDDLERAQAEPSEPQRPRCQKGSPGCKR